MGKLIFDLTVCQPNRDSIHHGGGIYGYIVFKELAKLYPDQIAVYVNTKRLVPIDVLDAIRDNGVPIIDAESESLLSVFLSKKGERLYSPLFSKAYEAIYSLHIPITVTIHGLRALEMNRDVYEYKYAVSVVEWIKSLVKQTPYYRWLEKRYYKQYCNLLNYPYVRVITVSEHSKHSLMCYYPSIKEELISVCYSPSTTDASYNCNQQSRPKEHYLIISANRWIKNAYRAVLALDYLYSNGMINHSTIILGINKDSNILRGTVNKDKFICMGYVSEAELDRCYYSAFALLYPTLNEGFGYPPLEAMKYGVPVIASSFASIQEVCGDAVMYTNPYSYMEIANRVLQLNDSAIYKCLEKRGLERYAFVREKQKADLHKVVNDIISK